MLLRNLRTCFINLHLKRFSIQLDVKTPQIMNLIELNKNSPNEFSTQIDLAVTSLKKGNVIALPTDTIYGLAVLAHDRQAIAQLYNIKKRDDKKPVAISVSGIEEIHRWCDVTVEDKILSALLPGQVTLVFRRTRELNPDLNPDTSLVGVRIPNDPFIRKVCEKAGAPVALTSANISAEPSSISVQEFTSLWPHMEYVFDGGELSSRVGSTVVDLSTKGQYTFLRPGCVLDVTRKILEGFNLTEVSPI